MLKSMLLFGVASILLGAGNIWSQEPTDRVKVPRKAKPFDLKQVKLLDGPFKDAMERDRQYVHSLDSDRLLHTWRINAGLPSAAQPLGGWEEPKCEVRGHSLGHYLSACALMYSSTSDEKLKVSIADKTHPIVKGLADFEILDEVYNKYFVAPDAKPLVTVDHPLSEKVITWTRFCGKAPVVYIQLGHGASAFNDSNYRKLVSNAIFWEAGRTPAPKVQTPAPAPARRGST